MTPAARLKIVRATQRKFTVSVAAIVTNERGEVLLLDHVLRPYSNWGIAGGFLEANEQPEDAIRREIREETGLELKNLQMVAVGTKNRHVEILFRAEATGRAEAKSREINAAAWFAVEEMPEDMSGAQKSEILDFLRVEESDLPKESDS